MYLKKTILKCFLLFSILFSLTVVNAQTVEAKIYTRIRDGGYFITPEYAKIKNGNLICKGCLTNWERAVNTKNYKKTGKFVFKLSKRCEIQDGYKPAWKISRKKFNKICRKNDESHKRIVVILEKNIVNILRFW